MELDQLNIPPNSPLRHPALIREPILRAGSSAALGFWLVATPAFFIACIVMKYWFQWHFGLLENFEDFWQALDRDVYGFWLQPLLLVVAPLAALIVNLLAVLHVQYDRVRRELNISVQLRWPNLLLAAVALVILGIFTLHAIGEYFHHGAGIAK